MDGYWGRSSEDFVVPKYQESSDTFAAPDIWGGWTMSSPEAPEKCFIMDHCDAMNHGFSGGLYGQMETGSVEESKKLNECEDLCSGSSLQGVKDDHRQLHDFDGIEQMDDIFLSSILEDVPGNWSVHSSSELGLKPLENVDVQCVSSSNNSVDSSAYADSLSGFDPSATVSDGQDVTMFPFVPCNSGPCHDMPLKPSFMIMDLSEENKSNGYCGVEPSLEVVLQDLQKATEKLTDETKKCFRDAFYRLAKNSLQDPESASTNAEGYPMQPPRSRGCDQGDRTRSRRNHETESGTNSIDRAIANLTFNKMESNIEINVSSA